MDKERDAIATRSGPAVPGAEDDRGSYDANKPLHEIEEDIARTRVRLSATIEALERELAPRRFMDNAAEVLRDALEPSPGSSRDLVSPYAIPLALIATGLGWVFMLRRRKWQATAPANSGKASASAVETGEAPARAPLYADVVDPAEPVSLADKKTEI